MIKFGYFLLDNWTNINEGAVHHFLAEAEKGPVEPREGLFQSREKSTKSIRIDDPKMGDILSVIVCIYILQLISTVLD